LVKKRVHEVARELDLESKELMRQLTRMGVETKSHMSTLDDADIVKLTNHYKAQNVKPATTSRPANNDRPAPQKPRDGADVGRQGAPRTGRENQRGGQNRYDRGPGLVDRVPSRPPDRRFTEKPRYNAGKGVPPRKNPADIQARPDTQPQPQPQSHEQPKPASRENQSVPQERQPAMVRPETNAGERRDNRDNRPRPAEHTQNTRTGAADSRQQRPQFEQGHKDGRPMGAPGSRGTGTSNQQGGASAPRGGAPAPRGGAPAPRGGAPAPRGGAPGPRGGAPGPRSGAPGPRSGAPGPRSGAPGPRSGAPGPRGGAPGPRSGAPGPRGGDAAKIKLAEKAKPDKVKALEKTKAQERVKQVEKQAYKGKADKKGRFDKRDLANEKSQAFKRGGHKRRPQQETRQVPVREKKPITIGETITVKNLAERMSISASEIIKKLMALGVMASINQEIDSDTATILANELGFKVHVKMDMEKEAQVVQETEDAPADLRARPCVVTIMGHVDHGKTSLLDSIRESNVTASEAGGITQHIGAYQVEHKGKKITFVDTPGHEAFTAMRARGAKVTDIAILVVAADDGVMPQTVEAINHVRAAGVPIIIAVNKIDKPDAEPQKVKRELTEYNLVAEEWGGETIFVEVSAKEKTNINELLEMILLVSEINEFKANPDRAARGTVIEAELDKGRGPVATILVQNGTLKVGDFIIAGVAYGKVRAMVDHAGRRVKKAGPSTPVEVLGFSEVPPAGELFFAVEGEKLGKQVVDERLAKKREVEMKTAAPKVSLDDLFNQIKEGQVKELNIIIKADVQGSVEAVRQALEKINTEEVRVNVIHGGVGAVTESDIMLASASNAIVIGFNVRPDVNARKAVEAEKIDIRLYRVIYDAIEDIKAAMSGLLEPEYKEVILGRVEVRKTFKVSKVGTIAGCYVTEGKITRDAGVRVIRDGIVVHEGTLESLKRFKDDVREVVHGYECGITVDRFNDIRENDQLEAFTTEAVKRELA